MEGRRWRYELRSKRKGVLWKDVECSFIVHYRVEVVLDGDVACLFRGQDCPVSDATLATA